MHERVLPLIHDVLCMAVSCNEILNDDLTAPKKMPAMVIAWLPDNDTVSTDAFFDNTSTLNSDKILKNCASF